MTNLIHFLFILAGLIFLISLFTAAPSIGLFAIFLAFCAGYLEFILNKKK